MDVRSMIDLMPPISWATGAMLAAGAVAAFLLVRWLFGPPAAPARRRAFFAFRAAILLVLLAILANPVRVDESPGAVERSKVVYLLDASRSMALGSEASRWDQAVGMVRQLEQLVPAQSQPERSVYRFGERLSAIELPAEPASKTAASRADAAEQAQLKPTEADTQLAGALRDLTGRFGRTPPRAVVLLSDGQTKDQPALEEIARRYAAMGVPIHAVPLGTADRKGDVAIAGLVLPVRVRKQSQVSAHVSVRSYGYDGRRTELVLSSLGEDGAERLLARLPITLANGLQSFQLTFQSEMQPMRVQASVPIQPDEVSTENNRQTTEIAVDRTKIRVLCLEGSPRNPVWVNTGDRMMLESGAAISRALNADPDIEYNILTLFPGAGSRFWRSSSISAAFPDTAAQLFAYDILLLNNLPMTALQSRELEWIEQWIARRGGGICFVGGPTSFASGGWRGSVFEAMLPVALGPTDRDWTPGRLAIQPVTSQVFHPIWNIVSDQAQNRAILGELPEFAGASRLGPPKPASTVLAMARPSSAEQPIPAIAVGAYGKGRTMAIAAGLDGPWASRWGEADNRYYGKFWRNVIYWLSESSSYGRRRLIAAADKILYRPGETVLLEATAYDEAANVTDECKVTVLVESRGAASDTPSDYSPLRWPRELKRTGTEQGPLVAWSEELEMPRRGEPKGYQLRLPITESASAVSATPSLRLELSAYEGATLVDSNSLDVQILDDPPELQNPMPNPQLLARLAMLSGGKVLEDAATLAAVIRELPSKMGPPVIRRTPLWSTWWLLGLLLGLLTVEWTGRRRSGLA